MHAEIYRARPDVGSVIHGHPLYGTALGATDARLEFLTHDAVLFTRRPGRLRRGPGAGHGAAARATSRRGGAGTAARGTAAQPRRGHRGRGRPLGGADGGDPRARHPVPGHRRDPRAAPADPAGVGGAAPAAEVPGQSSSTTTGRHGSGAWPGRRPGRGCRADDAHRTGASTERDAVIDVAPHELLLDVLRDRLALTGAKRSCDVQVCGTCTVLVDGAPVSACTYLAAETDGAARS